MSQEYYGFGRPGWNYGSNKRPGTVLAAAIVTWIVTGLTLFFVVGMVAMTLVDNWNFLDDLQPHDGGWSHLRSVVLMVTVALATWCIGALVLAYYAFRRRNWARMALVVSSAVTVFITLPSAFGGLPLFWTGSAMAVIVLLFTGGANEWYESAPSDRPASPKPPRQELPKFY